MTKVLVFGRTGQVARALARLQPATMTAQYTDRATADLAKPDSLAEIVKAASPDAIIIAAAYTAVDLAETDSRSAWAVNAAAPRAIGRAAVAQDIPVIHISTDYVFDGLGERPFTEAGACGPINVYGASKLAGELGLADSGARFVTLRTSWVYDGQGQNFMRTMLGLRGRASLDIVADQFGRPTHADDIAAAIWRIIPMMRDGAQSGVFHLTGNGPYTTWHGFAAQIFGDSGPKLTPVTTDKFPCSARRPANSRLDLTKIGHDLGIVTGDWRETLARCLKDME